MTRKLLILMAIALFAVNGSLASSPSTWLHVRVEESGPHGESVAINVPLDLVESLLPLISVEGLEHGKVHIDCEELQEIDVVAIVRELRSAEDGEYIVVEEHDERVRVEKRGDYLLIKVEERDEKVEIRIRLEVAEALFMDDPERLDLLKGIQALRNQGEGDLVTVVSEDERIRIWLDTKSSPEDEEGER